MALTVTEYIREDGSKPFQAWFNALPTPAAGKVAVARARLEMGNISAIKWIGAIGEYRIDWGPGYRMYLARDGEHLVILLAGGTKQRQQADIERAKALWAEYKTRKAAALRSKKKR
jgi:putative addiction module killer protein